MALGSASISGGGGPDEKTWPQYASAWVKADIAVTSLDRRSVFGVSASARKLSVAVYDGRVPNTLRDVRASDFVLAAATEGGKKAKPADRGALPFTAPARPVAGAFVERSSRGDEDSRDTLLVLMSTGHLLSIDAEHLGIESVLLSTFPGIRDEQISGPVLAVLADLDCALVAEGDHGVGLAPLGDAASSYEGDAKGKRAIDLPKGCSATTVHAYPNRGSVAIVGCGNGQLHFYQGAITLKGQVSKFSFTLIQALDISGSPVALPAFRGGFRSFFRVDGSAGQAPAGSRNSRITDAFVLDGKEDDLQSFVVAAGREGTKPGGKLAVWHATLDIWQEQSMSSRRASTAVCRLHAGTDCSASVHRVLMIAPGRCGSGFPILLVLDEAMEIMLWSVQPGQLVFVGAVSGRCPFDVAATRTFTWTGSFYLLVAMGTRSTSQVGWLDIPGLLEGCGVGQGPLWPTPPLCGRARSCLEPPLPAVPAPAASTLTIPVRASVGEAFFMSESALRCYSATTGRTSEVRIAQASPECRLVSILDVFVPAVGGVAYSRMLLAVMEPSPDGQAASARAAWLTNGSGDVLARFPGAFDGAILGQSIDGMFVAWIASEGPGSAGTVAKAAPVAAATQPSSPPATLAAAFTSPALGIERVLGCPVSGGRRAIYWGSRLVGGPLRISALLVAGSAAAIGPGGNPAVALPLSGFGPADLVDARWDSRTGPGPWCLALAAAHALWVVRFEEDPSQSDSPQASLLAWLDLRAAAMGVGRALSIAWLRPPAAASPQMGQREGTGVSGMLLVSMPWGVVAWPVRPNQMPCVLALTERPQLLCGALPDRLLCMETQGGINVFAGADRAVLARALGPSPSGSRIMGRTGGVGAAHPYSRGPRARMRTRPVGLLEAVMAQVDGAATNAGAAANCLKVTTAAVASNDWRLAPAVLSDALPREASRGLWPAASSSEAPPQLCLSAPVFRRVVEASGETFRGLAAVVCGFQANGRRRLSKGAGETVAEQNYAAAQVEEAVLRCRINPAYFDFLHCAASLLLDCAKQISANSPANGLAIASRGLAKHDLLPCGMIVATTLRAALRSAPRRRSGEERAAAPLPCRAMLCHAGPSRRGQQPLQEGIHWTRIVFSMAAPLAAVMAERALSLSWAGAPRAPPPPEADTGATFGPKAEAFTASALVNQQFGEPPTSQRPAGSIGCQLHTATLMQWLGLGATELRVRVFQAILRNEIGAEVSPGGSRGHAPSTPTGMPSHIPSTATHPPKVLASGLLVYWRCADGEGEVLRDSGGCIRTGIVTGQFEWEGPMPADEPMDISDEWGSPLAPNFAVLLRAGAEIQYAPIEGVGGTDDRQMLSLVGGSRSDDAGARHLKEALVSGADEDDEGRTPATVPGWTVEFWLRLTSAPNGQLELFSRPCDGDGAPSLSWSYSVNSTQATLLVRAAAQASPVLTAVVEAIPVGEWTHMALRSDLSVIEVWVSHQIVGRSAAGAPLPVVPLEARLRFGPAAAAEFTEIRVWGALRSDMDLSEQQRRPLPTVLQIERRADVWKKVRIRASGVGDAGLVAADGGFGLTKLVAPIGRKSSERTPRKPSATRQESDADKTEDLFGVGDASSFGDATPFGGGWGGASPFGDVADPFENWGAASGQDAWGTADAAAKPPAWGSPDGSSPLQWPAEWNAEDSKAGFADDKSGPANSTAGSPLTGGISPAAAESGGGTPTPQADAGTPVGDFATMPASAPSAAAPPPPTEPGGLRLPAEALPNHRDESSSDSTPSPRPEASPDPAAGKTLSDDESSTDDEEANDEVASEHPSLPAPVSPAQKLVQSPMVMPGRIMPWSRAAVGEQKAAGEQRGEPPGPGSVNEVVARPAKMGPDLQEVLPRPWSDERAGVDAVDVTIRAATRALETRSYAFAATAFRMAIGKLVRLLPTRGGAPAPTPAVRARLEAIAAYGTLCQLLYECDELRRAPSNGSSGGRLQRLCLCWACVLRIAKAPRHTVIFAVQAMANFFTCARHVPGGWVAAQQVATMLLDRCRDMLSPDEIRQAEYVEHATKHAAVARGTRLVSTLRVPVCGSCPDCAQPLEPLVPYCGACGTEVAVCFREKRLCSAQRAVVCTLCSAVESEQSAARQSQNHQHFGGLAQSVRARRCFVCGVGELQPRQPFGSREVLSF